MKNIQILIWEEGFDLLLRKTPSGKSGQLLLAVVVRILESQDFDFLSPPQPSKKTGIEPVSLLGWGGGTRLTFGEPGTSRMKT